VDGHDLADVALVDVLHPLLLQPLVAVAEAGDDRQALLPGLLARLDHAAHAGGVGRHRLLAEDVLAGGDGVLQLHRAEAGRRREQDDVDAGVDDLLVGVQAEELVVRLDGDLLGQLGVVLKALERRLKAVAVHVAHGGELAVAVGTEGLGGGPGAAAAAADEADLEGVGPGGVDEAGGEQHAAGEAGLKEFASVGHRRCPRCGSG
jgi:hypothetical protein